MGTTFKCDKCGEMFRLCGNQFELDEYQREHNKKCSGKFENIWKNYDKMSNKEKEIMVKAVMFKYGKITE